MLLYTDILTGDELFSDAFPIKVVDGIFYEVDGALVTVKEGEVDIGANPSAEEAEEERVEDSGKSVINIVNVFGLVSASFDKKGYMAYLKVRSLAVGPAQPPLIDVQGYMKAVKTKIEDAHVEASEKAAHVEAFEKDAQAFAKKIISNFKDYEFYIGSSCNPDGMVVLLNYREDGVTPYFTYLKPGTKENKM